MKAEPVASVDPVSAKTCCAALWSHPAVRVLVGDSLHPGGPDLTAHLVACLGLPPGSRVLDLGCGPGATLETLASAGLAPVGADYSLPLATEAAVRAPRALVVVADGERLPFRDGSFDGVVAECVLSVIPDIHAAAREVARVVRRGGRVAISDVIREGPVPAVLDAFASRIACVGGALTAALYRAALRGAGFDGVEVEDRREALIEMIDRVRRRLALLQGSLAVGLLRPGTGLNSGPVDAAQALLGQAAEAARAGSLGYAVLSGTKA